MSTITDTNDFRDFSDIISTSQPLNLHRDSEERLPATQGNALCSTCCRTFKTTRGLNQHRRNCQQNWKNVTKQTNTVLTSSEISDNPILNQEVNEVEQPETFFVKIERLYEELVYWKRNLFEIPTGNAGKEFINELTSYVNQWCSNAPDRAVAIKIVMILPQLMLQRTSLKAKSSENKHNLERRLELWKNNEIDELIDECKTIQQRISQKKSSVGNNESISKRFANYMLKGNVNAALRLLNEDFNTGVMPLTEETMQCLQSKHPTAQLMFHDVLLEDPIRKINQIIFNEIDAELIARSALRTKGAAGPSGLDADQWKRILSTRLFGSSSTDLCKAISRMAIQLCTTVMDDPDSISSLLACRLIPLNKNPGVRPIGIGEVLRRIIGKSVMIIFKPEVQSAAGYIQLCAGQEAGCETAVHAAHDIFDEEDSHGVIQIDASNAFNNLNRNVLLHNIKILSPEISKFVINCYSKPSRLFITGGKELTSSEGTTQGDPISMAIYAIGIIPLMTMVMGSMSACIKQIAFADDLTGIGTIEKLKEWWDLIIEHGPYIGYYVNAQKSWLICKQQHLEHAKQIFADSPMYHNRRPKTSWCCHWIS